MSRSDADTIRGAVREKYATVAAGNGHDASGSDASPRAGCCAPASCGGPGASFRVGYTPEEVDAVPAGADLGLGCGNPQAIASLAPGETVLDLGAGGGFDAFLAARQVGPRGFVIGVDMTPEMVSRARGNARQANVANVDFRLGEIEHLPVADASVDVIMSNCVINLSPAKAAVFDEAFRVLKPGGRLAISDVVAIAPMPEAIAQSVAAFTGCIAGAAAVGELREMLTAAGFSDIRIAVNAQSREFIRDWMPGGDVENYVASAMIQAVKRS